MTDLKRLSDAERQLATTADPQVAKDIRDLAELARQYAKKARLGIRNANKATSLRIRADHRGASLLAEMAARGERDAAGGDRRSSLHDVRMIPTLADLGWSPVQATRARAIARVGEDRMEAVLAEFETRPAEALEELTTASFMRAARVPVEMPDVAPPVGTYRCIVIDPPWPMKKIERDEQRPGQGAALDYFTMTLEDIEALPIPDLVASDGCHVYLWVTHKHLRDGLDLFDSWGVEYQCLMTWVKNVGITPFSWMYDTEHVLFGHVGSLDLTQLGLRLSFSAPTIGHSRKPDIFYERVVAASPSPRLEMFQRGEGREGFTGWGNEAA